MSTELGYRISLNYTGWDIHVLCLRQLFFEISAVATVIPNLV